MITCIANKYLEIRPQAGNEPPGNLGGIAAGTVFTAVEQYHQWFRLESGNWVSAGADGSRITVVSATPPPPSNEPVDYIMVHYVGGRTERFNPA